jgi:hypothetical protein
MGMPHAAWAGPASRRRDDMLGEGCCTWSLQRDEPHGSPAAEASATNSQQHARRLASQVRTVNGCLRPYLGVIGNVVPAVRRLLVEPVAQRLDILVAAGWGSSGRLGRP